MFKLSPCRFLIVGLFGPDAARSARGRRASPAAENWDLVGRANRDYPANFRDPRPPRAPAGRSSSTATTSRETAIHSPFERKYQTALISDFKG